MTGTNYINPIDIPGELLEKYHRSGPRYTSYPTAPQFKTGFPRKTVMEKWQETNDSHQAPGLSIYTHFPFCKSRCLYCGCFTRICKSDSIPRYYIEGLKRELDRVFSLIDPSRQVRQLALGGGTPTHLAAELLTDYMNALYEKTLFAPDAERSIEVDPRSVDNDYLNCLLQLGFNRFSFGVQDLDPTVQKTVNRVLEEDKLVDLLSYLRGRGIEAINLDLIYGLPGQVPDSFSATISRIAALRPSRIALFGYAHVPWASPHQALLEKYRIPDPGERMVLFGTAFHLLLEAGYRHIGMDHFALPGDELVTALENRTLTRNFMGYTTRRGLDLVGTGASAISSVGTTYVQNHKDIDAYVSGSSGFSWTKGLILTPEDRLRREIILDLFCNFYLDSAAVAQKYHIDFSTHFAAELEALEPMAVDGLLTAKNGELVVTQMGRFFIRNICMTFDRYLAKEKEDPGKRYSKTL